MDGVRKTAVVDRELLRLRIDIAALQETRLADGGKVKESNYTFFWQSLSVDNLCIHGVGLAVHNKLISSITTPVAKSARIISLQLSTKSGMATIISAYAPTLTDSQENKARFYDDLCEVVDSVPQNSQLFLLGDFNSRVGADYRAWPSYLGHFVWFLCWQDE